MIRTPSHVGFAMIGLIEEVYRHPLVRMKPENRVKLEKVMAAQGLPQPQKV